MSNDGNIKQGFLSKKGGQWRQMKVLDVAVLLFHIHRAAQDDQIGFEDARETLESITKRLNKTMYLPPEMVESALWSVNLSDEQGKYWHPYNLSFEQFVKQLLGGDKFNRKYNLIEKKDKGNE